MTKKHTHEEYATKSDSIAASIVMAFVVGAFLLFIHVSSPEHINPTLTQLAEAEGAEWECDEWGEKINPIWEDNCCVELRQKGFPYDFCATFDNEKIWENVTITTKNLLGEKTKLFVGDEGSLGTIIIEDCLGVPKFIKDIDRCTTYALRRKS